MIIDQSFNILYLSLVLVHETKIMLTNSHGVNIFPEFCVAQNIKILIDRISTLNQSV